MSTAHTGNMGGMLEIWWFLGARRDQMEMAGEYTRTFWEETGSDFGHGKGRLLAPDVILGRLDGLFASDLPGLARSPQLPARLELRRQPEGGAAFSAFALLDGRAHQYRV